MMTNEELEAVERDFVKMRAELEASDEPGRDFWLRYLGECEELLALVKKEAREGVESYAGAGASMSAALTESDDEITEHDTDWPNLLIRAGYMRALAERMTGDDRLFLLRASRSLRALAQERQS